MALDEGVDVHARILMATARERRAPVSQATN